MRIHPLVMVAGVWAVTLGAWVLVPRSGEPALRVVRSPVPPSSPAEPARAPAVEEWSPLEAQAASAPFLTGKILKLAASPDGERIAFVLERSESDHALGIYDLKARSILSVASLPHPVDGGELMWSPDSRHVTTREIASTVVLDRTGKAFRVALEPGAYQGIWSPDRPGTIIYVVPSPNCSGVNELREYKIWKGEGRLLRRVVMETTDLQVVSGHLCFVSSDLRKPGAKGRLVRVRRVDSGRDVFRLWLPRQEGPVYDPAGWDLSELSLSPDGRSFFARFLWSGSTMSLLARTMDAGAVFKRPRIASLYEAEFRRNDFVRWVMLGGRWLARMANVNDGSGDLIDPETGAITNLALRGVQALDFLPNGNQVSVIAPGLALSGRTNPDWDPDPEKLLIALRKPSGIE